MSVCSLIFVLFISLCLRHRRRIHIYVCYAAGVLTYRWSLPSLSRILKFNSNEGATYTDVTKDIQCMPNVIKIVRSKRSVKRETALATVSRPDNNYIGSN